MELTSLDLFTILLSVAFFNFQRQTRQQLYFGLLGLHWLLCIVFCYNEADTSRILLILSFTLVAAFVTLGKEDWNERSKHTLTILKILAVECVAFLQNIVPPDRKGSRDGVIVFSMIIVPFFLIAILFLMCVFLDSWYNSWKARLILWLSVLPRHDYSTTEIDQAVEQVSKQHLRLKNGLIYNGEKSSQEILFHLLRVLGLSTEGTTNELVARIDSTGLKVGDNLRDKSIYEIPLEQCHVVRLKAYLISRNLPTDVTSPNEKEELVTRVRESMLAQPIPVSEDKSLLRSALSATSYGREPSFREKQMMFAHGYQYIPVFNCFFHVKTHDKVIGENSILDNVMMKDEMFYPTDMYELL